MRCGSSNLGFLKSISTDREPVGFILPGVRYGIAWCRDCDFEGIPILFKDEEEHNAYKKDLVTERSIE